MPMDGGSILSLTNMRERWYVAECADGQHRAMSEVAERLDLGGFEVFYPTERQRRRVRARCRGVVVLPLFPRFLFVRLDLADPLERWKLVPRIEGVRHLLWRGHERPTPLPLGAVAELQANQRVRDAEFDDVVRRVKPPPFREGAEIRVTQRKPDGDPGPFFGLAGTVLVSSAERVRVLLGLFSGEVPVELGADEVEAA